MRKKILVIFGTRPEAIKMAPLVKELQKQSDKFIVLVCVTAQHREMLDQVLDLFEIEPDYDLNIMQSGQDLYDVTSKVLVGMRDIIKESNPHLLLVHGDTATSMAAALAGFYQQISVGHVEAGLRTHNIYSPWPEEMNRQITGRIATYHFTPTTSSKENLINEGINQNNIQVTGNTIIDALYWVVKKIENTPNVETQILEQLQINGISVENSNLWFNNERKMILITGHRRENFGLGFKNICEAIKELSEKYTSVDFIYPMHLNPNVRNAIKEVFGSTKNAELISNNVFFLEPLEYLPFVYLMKASYFILTDSGGIQEEAPSLGKPVLVMRDTTERPEALRAGTVRLTGTIKNKIISEVEKLLNDEEHYKKMALSNNPYGDGESSSRILDWIDKNYKMPGFES